MAERIRKVRREYGVSPWRYGDRCWISFQQKSSGRKSSGTIRVPACWQVVGGQMRMRTRTYEQLP